jgi:OFA family oxalate/formate antiporter-like MFS transporter
MLAFGFLHAWSIFLEPLQSSLERSRSTISAIYSLATVWFTVGMLVGPELRVRLPRRSLATGVCLLAAAGIALAGAGCYVLVLVGYEGMFAGASGIGTASPSTCERCPSGAGRTGHGHGRVRLRARSGAVLGAPGDRVRALGITATLLVMAAFVGLIGVIQVTLLHSPVMSSTYTEDTREVVTRQPPRTFWLLWLGFLLGSASGLMAIGHAAGIVVASGRTGRGRGRHRADSRRQRSRAPGRRLAQRLPLDQPDLGGPALRGGAVCAGAGGQYAPALVVLATVGSAYGAMSAGYPVAAGLLYGRAGFTRVYGRVFTAWGLAGLSAPCMGRVFRRHRQLGGGHRRSGWLGAVSKPGERRPPRSEGRVTGGLLGKQLL